MKHLVAVYGTLKRGCSNSGLLREATFLGEDALTGLTLYDLGPYPGAVIRPSDGVVVEVYAINDRILADLDVLEDYFPAAPEESLYLRKRMATHHGSAWVYIYNRPVASHRRITSGVW
ncbi:gamma-glutamylcyclotransferase family protein [Marinobacter sp. M216]|uniref:Gamma-glutamylcyclotransferase family protein n=1 Tax=Marinobacter albus TaxID=3030833 RepID=A0ABT7HH99_9GAMM|nr:MULTISPECIES: gamma-glutamylcyclotransferase family protein [unclassified Marinobacter]MBW7472652.1 gamma-glutamylcyclotransferase [Marinobacter sp. F4218]MDK9559205.1 gamma-glutamylcyclotransferase family protein [Marinobacter sp. M216]